jgi:hypothetical protein
MSLSPWHGDRRLIDLYCERCAIEFHQSNISGGGMFTAGARSALLGILLAIFFSSGPVAQAQTLTRFPQVSARDLDQSMASATEALNVLLREDGAFVYEARLDGRSVRRQYNLVRHAGTIYALNMFESRSLSPVPK